MLPVPLPREVYQVNFIALEYDYITLHKLISCPGPCIGHTGRFLLLFLVLNLLLLRFLWPGMTPFYVPTCRFGGIHQMYCFLFECGPLPCVKKTFLAVSRRSQKLKISVSPWVVESNP